MLVTTNLAFGEWPEVLGGDKELTTAILDRFAHHAKVIRQRAGHTVSAPAWLRKRSPQRREPTQSRSGSKKAVTG